MCNGVAQRDVEALLLPEPPFEKPGEDGTRKRRHDYWMRRRDAAADAGDARESCALAEEAYGLFRSFRALVLFADARSACGEPHLCGGAGANRAESLANLAVGARPRAGAARRRRAAAALALVGRRGAARPPRRALPPAGAPRVAAARTAATATATTAAAGRPTAATARTTRTPPTARRRAAGARAGRRRSRCRTRRSMGRGRRRATATTEVAGARLGVGFSRELAAQERRRSLSFEPCGAAATPPQKPAHLAAAALRRRLAAALRRRLRPRQLRRRATTATASGGATATASASLRRPVSTRSRTAREGRPAVRCACSRRATRLGRDRDDDDATTAGRVGAARRRRVALPQLAAVEAALHRRGGRLGDGAYKRPVKTDARTFVEKSTCVLAHRAVAAVVARSRAAATTGSRRSCWRTCRGWRTRARCRSSACGRSSGPRRWRR